jgi:hypothetical protein
MTHVLFARGAAAAVPAIRPNNNNQTAMRLFMDNVIRPEPAYFTVSAAVTIFLLPKIRGQVSPFTFLG